MNVCPAHPAIPLRKVLHALRNLAPEYLACAWDNVGLLVEPSGTNPTNRIMVTNDLTSVVLNEAMEMKVNLIVSYHPPIFKPMKGLTHKSWKEKLIIRCIENRIAVYSPHTALDVIHNGTNDYLLKPFEGIKTPIKPLKPNDNKGEGRIITLKTALSLEVIVDMMKSHLDLQTLRLCKSSVNTSNIKRIAVCAGSGASVLDNVSAHLFITGEMSHHDVLNAVQTGTHVICCEHTNSERQYLSEQYVPELRLALPSCEVFMSQTDRDPFTYV